MILKNLLFPVALLLNASIIAQTSSLFRTQSTSGCAPLQIQFQNQSQNANAYFWDFGDGNTSTLSNPTHLYTSPGVYSVSLIAIGNTSQDTLVKNDYIRVGQVPIASYQIANSTACVNTPVNFINQGDTSYQYTWIFGDGSSMNSYHASHTYSSSGNYQVSLQITNLLGCTHIEMLNPIIQISAVGQVNFSADSLTRCNTGLITKFFMNSSLNGSFVWNFGDGILDSVNPNPIHIYQQEGLYTVSLKTIDSNSCESIVAKPDLIQVHIPDTTQIYLSDSIFCQREPITLWADSNLIDYQWIFDDGTSLHGQNISKEFITAGKQEINFIGTDSIGCKVRTKSDSVLIRPSPYAAFSIIKDTACVPFLFAPKNYSIDAKTYLWVVGNDSLTHKNPLHWINDAGVYDVQLIVNNEECSDQLFQDSLLYLEGGKTDIILDDSIGCAPHEVNMTLADTNFQSITWIMGNGDTLYGPQINYTYSAGGTFVPKVFLENSNCLDSIFLPYVIEVIDEQSVFSEPDTIYLCQPGAVTFDGFSIGGSFWEWSFGTGDSSNQADPTYYFNSPGVYEVALNTQNTEGCYYRLDPYNVVVVKDPVAHFDTVVTSCPYYQVDFTSLDSSVVTWFWEFGNGHTDTVSNPTHYYGAPGYYNVSLTTWDINGCLAKNTVINGIAIEQCIGDGTIDGGVPGMGGIGGAFSDTLGSLTECVPYTMSLKMPLDSVISQRWLFGDGHQSTQKNPTHIYTTKGTYTITLIVQTSLGIYDTIINPNFIKLGGPTADFEMDRDNLCDGSEVQFINKSIDANSYTWDFGSQGTSFAFQPKLTFTESNEIIRLTALDNLGCSSSMIKNIAFGAPNPYFNFKEKVCLGDSIIIRSNVADYHNYQWEIGLGNYYYGKTLRCLANDTGLYSIKLHVTDTTGCVKTIESTVDLIVSNPIANFSFVGQTEHCDRYPIQVINSSVGADDYMWNFGNGDSTEQKNPIYRFTEEGEFYVSLTARKDGCTSMYTINQKVVINKAKPDFSVSQNSNCLPIAASFNDLSASAVSWKWQFGDDDTSNLKNPVHMYTAKPKDIVSLTIQDDNGCLGTKKLDAIKLHEAKPEASSWEGCLPLQINFYDNTSGVQFYQWDFGDGSTSNLKNPTYTYHQEGIYDITLITRSVEGCSDTLLMPDAVYVGNVTADFISVDSAQSCSPHLVHFDNLSEGATQYKWLFGDGGQSSKENPFYVYGKQGVFNVSLIADNQRSCIDTITQINRFRINSPEINFSMSDSISCGPIDLELEDLSQRVQSRKWFFGDGGIGSLKKEVHPYLNEGVYQISLMVTDTAGCVEYKSQNLKVLKKPKVSFSLDSVYGCAPINMNFRNHTTNAENIRYEWQIGNDIFSSLGDTSYYFESSGIYTIGLYAINDNGCEDEALFLDSLNIYGVNNPTQPKIWSVSVVNNKSIDLEWEKSSDFEFKKYTLFKTNDLGQDHEYISFYNRDQNRYSISFAGDHESDQYKLESINYCVQTIGPTGINPYVSLDLNLSAGAYGINLSWNKYKTADIAGYKIYRRQKSHAEFKQIASISAVDTTYLDTAILCNEAYIYKIEAYDIYGLDYTAASDWEEIIPIVNLFTSNSIVVERATVVNNDAILLEWTLPNINTDIVKGIILNRSEVSGNPKRVGYLPYTSTSYLDNQVLVDHQNYTYQLEFDHTCLSNSNMKEEVSSIWLSIESDGSMNYLRWTPAIGLNGGVKEYLVQKKNEYGNWETIETVSFNQLNTIIDMYQD